MSPFLFDTRGNLTIFSQEKDRMEMSERKQTGSVKAFSVVLFCFVFLMGKVPK